jgi:hypothetical protein
MKILKSLDHISPDYKVFHEESERMKSPLGGILSIIVYFLGILCFAGFGIDLIQKKSPDILFSKFF